MASTAKHFEYNVPTQKALGPVEATALTCQESAYVFRWHNSVEEIAPTDWARCFQTKDFARTYCYQQAVEASCPTGVRFQYLVAYKNNRVFAIVGCFRYRIPLSTTATGVLRKLINSVERFLPNLFCVNVFFVGQLTAVCDHLYGIEQLPKTHRSTFLARCESLISRQARALRCSLVIHKEIPHGDLALVSKALGASYVFAPSPPAMNLCLRADQPYQQQLRKKYRNNYRRRNKVARERGLTWDIHRGPLSEALTKDMEALYLQVLDRSGTAFERLSSSFFSAVMERCADACVVLCRDGPRLVGFMLNMNSNHAFHGLYLGYDESYRDAAVYFNLIYRSLDVAQERGHKTIHLGQTSYEAKSALGAQRTNLYLALRARNPLIHAVLKCFRNHLFPETNVPIRRAFRVEPH